MRPLLAAASLLLAACSVAPSGGAPPAERDEGSAPERAEPTPPAALPRGRMVELGRFGDDVFGERDVTVYVPPGAEARGPLPVLYVSDGQLAFDLFDVDGAFERLIAERRIEPWLVVAVPSGSDRAGELAARAERFTDFVLDAVAPAVEARFEVRPGRESVAVLGYSFGGLFAVRAHLHRPEDIGRVIAMSPSLWFRRRAVNRAFASTDAPLPDRLWIDVGTEEARGRLPYMVADARALRDAALARGMRFGRTVGYAEISGETHVMNAAGRRMAPALAFALGDPTLDEARPVAVTFHQYPRIGRLRAFAIQARYAEDLLLTWPTGAADVRAGGASVSSTLVSADAPLTAVVAGVATRDAR